MFTTRYTVVNTVREFSVAKLQQLSAFVTQMIPVLSYLVVGAVGKLSEAGGLAGLDLTQADIAALLDVEVRAVEGYLRAAYPTLDGGSHLQDGGRRVEAAQRLTGGVASYCKQLRGRRLCL